MSATEMFQAFNNGLSTSERALIETLLRSRSEELMAARSEDARVRLAESYIGEAREWLKHSKKENRR